MPQTHSIVKTCSHCGGVHAGQCPRIRVIEYYENGNIKAVEYFDPPPQPAYGIGGPPAMAPLSSYPYPMDPGPSPAKKQPSDSPLDTPVSNTPTKFTITPELARRILDASKTSDLRPLRPPDPLLEPSPVLRDAALMDEYEVVGEHAGVTMYRLKGGTVTMGFCNDKKSAAEIVAALKEEEAIMAKYRR